MSQKAFGAETDIFNTYRLSSYLQNKYLNTFSKMAQFCEVWKCAVFSHWQSFRLFAQELINSLVCCNPLTISLVFKGVLLFRRFMKTFSALTVGLHYFLRSPETGLNHKFSFVFNIKLIMCINDTELSLSFAIEVSGYMLAQINKFLMWEGLPATCWWFKGFQVAVTVYLPL